MRALGLNERSRCFVAFVGFALGAQRSQADAGVGSKMSAPIIARLTIRESLGASRGSLHASQSSSATTINAARRRAFVTVSASDAPDKRTTLREESKADNFKLRANDTLVAFTYDAQVRANAVC